MTTENTSLSIFCCTYCSGPPNHSIIGFSYCSQKSQLLSPLLHFLLKTLTYIANGATAKQGKPKTTCTLPEQSMGRAEQEEWRTITFIRNIFTYLKCLNMFWFYAIVWRLSNNELLPNDAVEWTTPFLRIRKLPVSNLGLETGYPEFPQSLQANTGIYFGARVLPHPY
jgi:hypothetical protein